MPSDRPKKPHGHFTPASTIGRVLTRGGFHPFRVSRGIGFGGHRCSWDEVNRVVRINYRCSDSTPDDQMDAERAELIDLYAEFLKDKGYHVKRTRWALYVNPVKETDMPKPTLAEQIAAVALLREFARNTPNYVNPTAGELAVAEAFHTLDNADLFAALDQERFEQEVTQEDRTP